MLVAAAAARPALPATVKHHCLLSYTCRGGGGGGGGGGSGGRGGRRGRGGRGGKGWKGW